MEFSSKNTGVGCHFFLEGIFPTQGSSLMSSALAGRFFTTVSTGKSISLSNYLRPWPALERGCVNFPFSAASSHVGRVRMSPELNKGTVIFRQRGQGSHSRSYRQLHFSDYNNKSKEKQRLKWKKQIQHGIRVCSSLLHSENLSLMTAAVNT